MVVFFMGSCLIIVKEIRNQKPEVIPIVIGMTSDFNYYFIKDTFIVSE